MKKKAAILVLFEEQLRLARASAQVLLESHSRAQALLLSTKDGLTPAELETLEALTARFSRFSDYLVQRVFRTLDEVEMGASGTALDSLNRMEKRGIIDSVDQFREIRALRNEIAHEYLIEPTDRVVRESFEKTPILIAALEKLEEYSRRAGYLSS
jgi:hypothetical protein